MKKLYIIITSALLVTASMIQAMDTDEWAQEGSENLSASLVRDLAAVASAETSEFREDPLYGTIFVSTDPAINALFNDPELPVKQLVVEQQTAESGEDEDITCGSRAILNAWAIQELLTSNMPINSKNIIERSKQKSQEAGCLLQYKLEIDDVKTQIDKVHLNNAFVTILSSQHNYEVSIIEFGELLYTDEETGQKIRAQTVIPITKNFMIEQIGALQNNDAYALQFICNSADHWVTVSLVKQNDQKPVIIYMNSKNSELTTEYSGFPYVQTIHAMAKKALKQLNPPPRFTRRQRKFMLIGAAATIVLLGGAYAAYRYYTRKQS